MEMFAGIVGGILLIGLGVFLIKKAKKNGCGSVYNASQQYRTPRNEPWMKK